MAELQWRVGVDLAGKGQSEQSRGNISGSKGTEAKNSMS